MELFLFTSWIASPDEALPKLENSTRELRQYLNSSRLQLVPEKCKLYVFKNKRSRAEKEWVININGKKITPGKVVKFLGLYFEADLKWILQVEAVRQKCIQTTWMGVNSMILLQLYTVLIRSCIQYGSIFTPSVKVRWIC